ncbi:MAG: NAD(P)/FAD-dependent oxidoreductase [Rhizobiaceae bacterium]
MHDIETLIIGAGVVGLAIARSLAIAGHEILVVEKNDIIGSETSARNSEVIHAGIYYPKDSFKARLCVEGKHLLYSHCASHGVPHRRIGKLIVASDEGQKSSLLSIRERAVANGVDDLELLDQSATRAMEPALGVVAGLFSPSTGIIDSHAYMLSLQGDAEANGGQLAFNTQAISWEPIDSGGFRVAFSGAENMTLTCRNLIISGGLHSSTMASNCSAVPAITVPPTLYAKGNYFRLNGRAPFSHLIYPVPEPGGLGVHLTLDMGGQARFGPDVEWVDGVDYEVDPSRGEKFYAAIRSYWPDLPDACLEPDYAGIRPKLVGPGEPAADFQFWGPDDHGLSGLVGLFGMESPGLTASLAIANHVQRIL